MLLLKLKKGGTILLVGLMVLLMAMPLISAGSYGSGAYSAGDYNVGAVSAPDSGGSSEGGSSWQCSEDEDCGDERFCLKHRCYDYSCYSDSDCNISVGETCWLHRCVKLFDIKIVDFQSPIQLGTEFEFTYFLKGMADISGDVEVHFWIEKDGEAVTSGHDTIYIGNFEEKTEKTKIYLPTTIDSGVYTFFVQLSHGDYVANTHRTIEIAVGEGGVASIIGVAETAAEGFELYAIPVLVGFALLMILIIFWLERKKISVGIIKEEKWIKKHKITTSVSILFIILSILIYCLDSIGYISLSDVGEFFVDTFLSFSSYFYHFAGSIIILISLIIVMILFKRGHVFEWGKLLFEGSKRKVTKRRLKAIKPEINKSVAMGSKTNPFSFLSKHKRLFAILLIIAVFVGVLTYLFYSGIFTVVFLQGLWDGIVNWLGIVASSAKTIYPYLSPQNEYFYPVVASIVGLVVLVILGIIVKRNNLFRKFKSWQEQRGIESRRVENVQARAKKLEDFKETVKKYKMLLIVLGILILSCGVIGILFYQGVVTIERISEGIGDVANSVQAGWESVLLAVKTSVIVVGNFIKDYSAYLISSIVGITVLLVSYLRRKNLSELFKKSSSVIKDLPKIQKVIISIVLGIVSFGISVYALIYYGILSVEQFNVLFSNFGEGVSELGRNSWSNIQFFLSNTLNWIIQNYVYLVGGVLVVASSVLSYLKRNDIKRGFYGISNFVIEHKLFFLILFGLAVIFGLVFYLFFIGIVTIERISEGLGNVANSVQAGWESVVEVVKGVIFRTGDFIRDYYVQILSCVAGVMLILVTYLKRRNLIEFFKGLIYRFRSLSKKQKVIAWIALLIILLSVLLYALIYYGILSIEQFGVFFSNFGERVSEFVKNIVGGASNLWGNIRPFLSNVLDWIIQNYIYLIGGVLAIVLIIISYLRRENLRQGFYGIRNFVIGHKLFFLILLILMILSGIVFYLFYSNIITVGKLKEIFDFKFPI